MKGVADNLKLSPLKHEHHSNPVLSQKGTPGETRITPWKYLEFVFQKQRPPCTGIMSSAIGLKICAKTGGIKKSMMKKKKKKHDKIVFLTKSKLNSIEVLISKALRSQSTLSSKIKIH